MRRIAGWAALAALVVGLLGMAGWLWPHFRTHAAQRPNINPALRAPLRWTTPAPDAQAHTAVRATQPGPIAPEGSCKAWFSTRKDTADAKALQAQLLAAQAQGEARLNQWLAQTAQIGSPAERAAALYLKVLGQAGKFSRNSFGNSQDCNEDLECSSEAGRAVAATATADVNALAKMAAVSRDPKLYGLAFQACQYLQQAPGYCTQISADQWTQRDPDNGIAWLYAASKAAEQGRESAKAEAIYRFAQAKKFDLGLSLLGDLTRSETLRSDTPFVASTATNWAFRASSTTPIPGYQVVMNYCTTTTLRDTNRAQICDAVANSMLRDDSTLVGPTLGLRMGERLAWPPSQWAPIREEVHALWAVQDETLKSIYGNAKFMDGEDLNAQGLVGCEAMDRIHAFMGTQLRLGEVGQLRDRLAHHTLSRAALAAQYERDHPAKR